MPSFSIVRHEVLTANERSALRALFDAEYASGYGPWDPELPYGYAPHDVHVIASVDGAVIGHVGWARREIEVGSGILTIGGVGGVLVAEHARGNGLARELMAQAVRAMRADRGIEFGYLGCREEVAPFYAACGWRRIAAVERSISRDGDVALQAAGAPIMVRSVEGERSWPVGDIDLRGRAW
ncbi:GNAT family N-acetyltransferase [Microbacterium sp. NPDC055903]